MNKKIVVIHQPDFAPYLGFFHRFLHSDLYVILDHVQYVNSSRGWTNRDKIKSANGEKWLTVSVKKTSRNTCINQVELAVEPNWRFSHLNLLEYNYKKAPYFEEIFTEIREIYLKDIKMLVEFNIAIIELLMKLLDVKIPWVLSSSLMPSGTKNDLLVDIIKKVSGSHYLSGIGAKDYFISEAFEQAGIEVLWQNFKHPVYKQRFSDFFPYLSSFDVLFNLGISGSRKVLRSLGWIY